MFCNNSPMTDPYAAATRAQDLERVAKAYVRAKRTYEDRRADLHRAVVEAVNLLGMSKSEAARISGYSREYVARICEDQS